MKKAIAVAALAFGALMGAAGTANATDYLETDSNGVPWHWATEAECQADSPLVWNDPHFDRAFPYWFCGPGDGGWYLYSTDVPH
ncbi:hypothetical protein [Mycolicibacterium sarraceniae]|uniref:Secreted protein n=1 Tax=Mycolicibacterium sarraceniae TaxID=1534348 RepID=A0A7I7SRU7_9MYCO|nr:hypothetical protein [Mycolicibacterium sarraceniae]BBY59737.1 hypothetical protein MSAR_28730 [Mycolicibacterium sarraceniae]